MLDVITKADYWGWRKLGIDPSGGRGTLKGIQDAFILGELYGVEGQRVCEMGGGHSRVLHALAPHNECWNVDKLEGDGGGPSAAAAIQAKGVKLVRAFVGENSDELPENYFDVVFSISVVEHVPDEAYGETIRDAARILKPGGRLIHAIDVYLSDAEDWSAKSPYQRKRLGLYLTTPELSEGRLEWLVPPAITLGLTSSGRHAVNQMDELFAWNEAYGSLTAIRETAQNCSLRMILTKKA